jgi:hypothetical protein
MSVVVQQQQQQQQQQSGGFHTDRYIVVHVSTTCDEHGVYVTKDSAEVIELGWILVDAQSLEEVSALGWRVSCARKPCRDSAIAVCRFR